MDQAGNYATASKDFTITPLATPQITEYAEELTPDDILTVKGKTYPETLAILNLITEKGKTLTQEVKSDQAGDFTIIWPDKLQVGSYQFTVVAKDSRGAKSLPTSVRNILVRQPPFIKIGQVAIGYLTVIVTIISLFVSLILVIFLGLLKVRRLKTRLKREMTEMEHALHQAFKLLGTDLRSQLKLLDRVKNTRKLTAEEERIKRQLQKTLDSAEQIIDREIKHIERELK